MYENLKFKLKTVIPTSIYFAHIDTLLTTYFFIKVVYEEDPSFCLPPTFWEGRC